jgi:NADP-dependent 3-hydroxy acid dehydrogenase YdfG
MSVQDVTVALPEHLYQRLQNAATATRRPLSDILIRAVEVGSPPGWEDVPAEFQVELASLDRLDDEALWRIARQRRSEADIAQWQDLLDKNANGTLTQEEAAELAQTRKDADRLTLCKAHAAALLRWRGHMLPPAESLT